VDHTAFSKRERSVPADSLPVWTQTLAQPRRAVFAAACSGHLPPIPAWFSTPVQSLSSVAVFRAQIRVFLPGKLRGRKRRMTCGRAWYPTVHTLAGVNRNRLGERGENEEGWVVEVAELARIRVRRGRIGIAITL
jgi:hypothetical protein